MCSFLPVFLVFLLQFQTVLGRLSVVDSCASLPSLESAISWLSELIAFIPQVFASSSPFFPSQLHSSRFIPSSAHSLASSITHHLSRLIVFVSDKIWAS